MNDGTDTSGGGGPPLPINQFRRFSSMIFNNLQSQHGGDQASEGVGKTPITSATTTERSSSFSSSDKSDVNNTNNNNINTNDDDTSNNDNNNAMRSRDVSFFFKNWVQHKDPPARDRPKDDIWPERSCLSFTRSLVFYGEGSFSEEHQIACKYIEKAREMRRKYYGSRDITFDCTNGVKKEEDVKQSNNSLDGITFKMGQDGIFQLFAKEDSKQQTNLIKGIPTLQEFVKDYSHLVKMASSGEMRSFSFQRLQMLTQAFKMHVTANGFVENEAQSNLLGTDFYRTMKVDNHIHLAAAPSARLFVNYVRDKLLCEPNTVVLEEGNKTLKQVFTEAGLDLEHLTIDAFNVLADYSVYQRFDNFNSKYSPFRLAKMRQIFLKTNNHIKGRYFAELTKLVLSRHEASKGHNSAAEMRLSIYGMEPNEWLKLAEWVLNPWPDEVKDDNNNRSYYNIPPGPVLSSHNRWIIQVPRLWRIYSAKGHKMGIQGRSFQDMIDNLFRPILEATLEPEKHPKVAEFLTHVVGFDSVDDEGVLEETCTNTSPAEWTTEKNPAFSWQLYHLWANIEVVNQIRKAKGLNTFDFRPHSGETGDPMHLAASYMLCRSINHGINLDNQVSLQYLYYLDQVGLSISPLSNNFLFRRIKHNPFLKLFQRGLNVTLSTDDPLLFHMSDDALLEEYSVARASFDLAMTDISEIARNSVLQSGFEDEWKKEWLGEHYNKGITYCDETKTHVPLIRSKYRAEHLAMEKMMVALISAGKGEEVLREMMVQFGLAKDAHRNMLRDCYMEIPFSL